MGHLGTQSRYASCELYQNTILYRSKVLHWGGTDGGLYKPGIKADLVRRRGCTRAEIETSVREHQSDQEIGDRMHASVLAYLALCP